MIPSNTKPDKKIIEILRKLSESDSSNGQVQPSGTFVLPKNVIDNLESVQNNIENITADMIQTVTNILKPKELVDLFAGNYTEQTANIIRNFARIKYPELASIMDPVKYFVILGKYTGLDQVKKQVISMI